MLRRNGQDGTGDLYYFIVVSEQNWLNLMQRYEK